MGRTLNENTAYFPEGAIRCARPNWLMCLDLLPAVGFGVGQRDGREPLRTTVGGRCGWVRVGALGVV